MMDSTINEVKSQMEKSIENYTTEVSKLRTGRANPAMVDSLVVDYYGTETPVGQMANISTPDATTIVIQPWDASALGEIERTLIKAELGVTPQNDGKMIRLPMPPLTEETRKEVVKRAGQIAEEARVSIRNVRRNGIDDLKKAEKDKEITEDDLKRGQERIQKLTDASIEKIDKVLEQKSKSIMEI